ncbi:MULTISPECIES: hypothetical protein [Streptomyces]|uniref:Secreted protein n=1 Tax=Streptomyces chengmaiensis TaxID=3040919 RepID=A0ABT6HWM1_9ACTN|nr:MULTISPECIES: hypothetical protein [Streptomyces]MDH2392454.1 hypothetical protein [Streptomyces chengmaiensis]WRQ81403.1 hypothetical protein I3F59_019780 [Streptomyces sp. MUM 178J]
MISIKTSTVSTAKMTDRSVVSACLLGLSFSFSGTRMSGGCAVPPVSGLGGLPVRERNERPTKALEAGAAAAQARAYAFAAASAEMDQTQHHTKWAFRGLEPWSDPA